MNIIDKLKKKYPMLEQEPMLDQLGQELGETSADEDMESPDEESSEKDLGLELGGQPEDSMDMEEGDMSAPPKKLKVPVFSRKR